MQTGLFVKIYIFNLYYYGVKCHLPSKKDGMFFFSCQTGKDHKGISIIDELVGPSIVSYCFVMVSFNHLTKPRQ